ncbi:hypothetical protein BC332_07355 [Capsicum chinense]|nr:hypothetical protein BC332_07355 [Capsicum chinense]
MLKLWKQDEELISEFCSKTGVEKYDLKHCNELKKIELLNLLKIKSVSIFISHNQCVKIQASTLEHLAYFGDSKESTVLDVV